MLFILWICILGILGTGIIHILIIKLVLPQNLTVRQIFHPTKLYHKNGLYTNITL